MSQRIPDRASGMSIRTHAERLRKRDPVLAEALTIVQSGVDQVQRELSGIRRLDRDGRARLDMSHPYNDSLAKTLTVRPNRTFDVADDGIVTVHIADLAVTNAKIANLAVTNAKINDLSATKITAGYLSADRLDTTVAYITQSAMIASAIITNAHVNDLSADKLTAGYLSAERFSTSTAYITNSAQIANLVVGNAHIASLAVDKITGWSGANINVGAGVSFTGGPVYVAESLVVDPGFISTFALNLNPLGSGIKVGSVVALDNSRNFDAASQYRIGGVQVVGSKQSGVSQVSETADDTYSTTERDMLNNLKASLNDLIGKLQTHGLIG